MLEWVWQIICCLIFITVLSSLLPKKSYEKYIRLFSGMILILVIIKPVTESLDLDEKLAALFQSVQFQEEAGEFRRKLSDLEQNRFDKMTNEYEMQVEEEVKNLARSVGIEAEKTEAEIEKDPKSDGFGTVRRIRVSAREETEGKDSLVSPVEPVEIRTDSKEEQPASAIPAKADLEKEEELKRRISQYYGVEERNVEIWWKN